MMSCSHIAMTFVGLVLLGCGGVAHSPHAPRPVNAPAVDIAGAKPSTQNADPAADLRPGSSSTGPKVTDLDTIRIQVVGRSAIGATEMTSVATADLFNEASSSWKNGKGDEAIGLFRRLVTEFPDSTYSPLALHNIAAVYDSRGDSGSVIATLRELIAAYPASRQSVEGHLYLAAVLAERKQWKDTIATLDQALARSNLTYADRIEGWARTGYAWMELGQLDDAEVSLATAVSEWKRAPYIEDAYFIAMAQYYRGELAHRRFQAVRVELPDDNLGKSLAAKEALAVECYDRWRQALSHRNAYWATAAGYQMSEVFFELWEATAKAPYPSSMSLSARPAYVDEVHSRIRHHLQKALEGHQMNLQLAQAYGVTTSWSDASRTRAARISEILNREARGEYLLPSS